MPKSYHHLTYAQRCQICVLKDRGDSLRSIARDLNIHHSTISRELKRNIGQRGYRYNQAQEKSSARRDVPPNQKMTFKMTSLIEKKLRLQVSPVQISGWLKRHGLDHVSHETIYKYIWADKKQGGFLYKELRHRGKKYNKRSKNTAGRGCIPNRIDIDMRPAIVAEKTRFGDWELDTIIGAGKSGALVSMVERTSKLTKIVKVLKKSSEDVGGAITKRLKPISMFVFTLTSDNGKEFSGHEQISKELEANFYFAKPYRSWERGLNEHTNGLVRQYFPKEKRFDEISNEDVERVETLLNNRPRKILFFETPLEAFERLSLGTVSQAPQHLSSV